MSSSTPAAVSTLFVKLRNNSTARYLEWMAKKLSQNDVDVLNWDL